MCSQLRPLETILFAQLFMLPKQFKVHFIKWTLILQPAAKNIRKHTSTVCLKDGTVTNQIKLYSVRERNLYISHTVVNYTFSIAGRRTLLVNIDTTLIRNRKQNSIASIEEDFLPVNGLRLRSLCWLSFASLFSFAWHIHFHFDSENILYCRRWHTSQLKLDYSLYTIRLHASPLTQNIGY